MAALKENENYLFFPETFVDPIGDGALFCTKNYLLFVPKQFVEIGKSNLVKTTFEVTTFNFFGDGVTPGEGLSKVIEAGDKGVEEMETYIQQILEGIHSNEQGKRCIFPINELIKMQIIPWLKQARVKMPDENIYQMGPKGKGAAKLMKQFYTQ